MVPHVIAICDHYRYDKYNNSFLMVFALLFLNAVDSQSNSTCKHLIKSFEQIPRLTGSLYLDFAGSLVKIHVINFSNFIVFV